MRQRLGFIKLAIQHGCVLTRLIFRAPNESSSADLVPVFSFGENDVRDGPALVRCTILTIAADLQADAEPEGHHAPLSPEEVPKRVRVHVTALPRSWAIELCAPNVPCAVQPLMRGPV